MFDILSLFCRIERLWRNWRSWKHQTVIYWSVWISWRTWRALCSKNYDQATWAMASKLHKPNPRRGGREWSFSWNVYDCIYIYSSLLSKNWLSIQYGDSILYTYYVTVISYLLLIYDSRFGTLLFESTSDWSLFSLLSSFCLLNNNNNIGIYSPIWNVQFS